MDESLKEAQKRREAARSAMAEGHYFDDAHDCMKRGDFKTALFLLEEARKLALEAFPDVGSTPAIEVFIGECYEQLGRYEEARKAYENAIALIENYPKMENHPKPNQSSFQEMRERATKGLDRLTKKNE